MPYKAIKVAPSTRDAANALAISLSAAVNARLSQGAAIEAALAFAVARHQEFTDFYRSTNTEGN